MLCLAEMERHLMRNGRSLKNFVGMPCCEEVMYEGYTNPLIYNEINYDKAEMKNAHLSFFEKLNSEQRKIYDEVVDAVDNRKGGFFFVYGHGGTGKTFVWKALSFKFREQGKIVLNVASSGIASLLLPGGRTAHSLFSIPICLNEESTCNIKQDSYKAELLRSASLIIWDEAPMVNKWAFEALDRTLRDIMRYKSSVDSLSIPFGGKVVVLGGDFRQILPVIPRGSRADIVMATINSSILWKHCKVLKLVQNMRLLGGGFNSDPDELKKFGEWVLEIGDGKKGTEVDGIVDVEIPSQFLILKSENHVESIVRWTYPNLVDNTDDLNIFEDRAILAPTLDIVEEINSHVLSLIPGNVVEYLSSDSICKVDGDVSMENDGVTTEFLNDIQCSRLPNHKLSLKVGAPMMLLRNIDQSAGLCNGTRLTISEFGKKYHCM